MYFFIIVPENIMNDKQYDSKIFLTQLKIIYINELGGNF